MLKIGEALKPSRQKILMTICLFVFFFWLDIAFQTFLKLVLPQAFQGLYTVYRLIFLFVYFLDGILRVIFAPSFGLSSSVYFLGGMGLINFLIYLGILFKLISLYFWVGLLGHFFESSEISLVQQTKKYSLSIALPVIYLLASVFLYFSLNGSISSRDYGIPWSYYLPAHAFLFSLVLNGLVMFYLSNKIENQEKNKKLWIGLLIIVVILLIVASALPSVYSTST